MGLMGFVTLAALVYLYSEACDLIGDRLYGDNE